MVEFHAYDSRVAAAKALADAVLVRLREGLDATGQATLVVPGGTSPQDFFADLRVGKLDWSRVAIVPSDERWLPVDHEESNERMLRECLLQDDVAAARLVGLYRDTPSPVDACDALQTTLAGLPVRFDAVVLGMGADGHTASLFPDASNIGDCLAANTRCVAPDRPADETPRLSLSLKRLLATREINLLFFGAQKRAVFEAATAPGPMSAYPVRGVLHQKNVPVHVYWSE